MKHSVAWQILQYPAGTETLYPHETIDGVAFYDFDIGGGRHVWRTRWEVPPPLEVGRVGGVWYGKVKFRILERIFTTHRQAMRRCVEIRTMIENGEIAYHD
jgi:hypothetical protein